MNGARRAEEKGGLPGCFDHGQRQRRPARKGRGARRVPKAGRGGSLTRTPSWARALGSPPVRLPPAGPSGTRWGRGGGGKPGASTCRVQVRVWEGEREAAGRNADWAEPGAARCRAWVRIQTDSVNSCVFPGLSSLVRKLAGLAKMSPSKVWGKIRGGGCKRS